MPKRKQTDIVDLRVRMREPLRASIARAAVKRGVSLNAEAVDRLEQSFDRQKTMELLERVDTLREAAMMMAENAKVFALIARGLGDDVTQLMNQTRIRDQQLSSLQTTVQNLVSSMLTETKAAGENK